MADVDDAKADLRRRLRTVRSGLVDVDADLLAARSRRIVERLVELGAVSGADRIVGYRTVPGEVDTVSLERWCGSVGVDYLAPDPVPGAEVPSAMRDADVIVTPGLAFDRSGGRLGQGGGWYDRVLSTNRPPLVVGLAFREQIVERVPMGAHDVRIDCVVDDDGAWWAS